ncbi:MAG: hypothetical protein C0514_05820 [Candidatus Puniceispirillum sp.]|nr:hypothetical protein [Candidatus Puniceispirillum sp.]
MLNAFCFFWLLTACVPLFASPGHAPLFEDDALWQGACLTHWASLQPPLSSAQHPPLEDDCPLSAHHHTALLTDALAPTQIQNDAFLEDDAALWQGACITYWESLQPPLSRSQHQPLVDDCPLSPNHLTALYIDALAPTPVPDDDFLEDTTTPYSVDELEVLYRNIVTHPARSGRTTQALLEEIARQAPPGSPLVRRVAHTLTSLSKQMAKTPKRNLSQDNSSPVTPHATETYSSACVNQRLRAWHQKAMNLLKEEDVASLSKALKLFEMCYRNSTALRWKGCLGMAHVYLKMGRTQEAKDYLSRLLKSSFCGKDNRIQAKQLMDSLE